VSLFGRLREKLDKTRSGLVQNVKRIFTGSAIDDSVYEQLEEILVQADFGIETALEIVEHMRKTARAQGLQDPQELYQVLKDELVAQLEPGDHSLSWSVPQGPHVTLIAGVNGSGKTTTTGKLAALLIGQGRTVLLGAADTFRAAAVEQLTIWSERTGASIVRHGEGADPASVAYDATDAAAARGVDNVLIDTAGRLHTKVNLMEEIKKIRRVIDKRIPGAPHQVLLVLDATTGQNALQQAKIFAEAIDVTGIILTKLDGTAKGGIVIAIQRQLGIPIKLIGVGEKVEDLRPFNPREFVDELFD
jgi:fused signal recognition particle receptor